MCAQIPVLDASSILFGWRPVGVYLRVHMCAQRHVLYASSILFGQRPVSFHLRVHMCQRLGVSHLHAHKFSPETRAQFFLLCFSFHSEIDLEVPTGGTCFLSSPIAIFLRKNLLKTHLLFLSNIRDVLLFIHSTHSYYYTLLYIHIYFGYVNVYAFLAYFQGF